MGLPARASVVMVIAAAATAIAVALSLVPGGNAVSRLDEEVAPLGLVGLSDGESLRISIANVVGFDPQPDPPGVCTLQVGFVDATNNSIGNPHILELRAGEARSIDYSVRADASSRHYVRPVVVDLRPTNGCAAVISGEILNPGTEKAIIIYSFVAFPKPSS